MNATSAPRTTPAVSRLRMNASAAGPPNFSKSSLQTVAETTFASVKVTGVNAEARNGFAVPVVTKSPVSRDVSIGLGN